MEVINVLAAAVAAFAFGAVWYIVMSKPWMAASGVTQGRKNHRDRCLLSSVFWPWSSWRA